VAPNKQRICGHAAYHWHRGELTIGVRRVQDFPAPQAEADDSEDDSEVAEEMQREAADTARKEVISSALARASSVAAEGDSPSAADGDGASRPFKPKVNKLLNALTLLDSMLLRWGPAHVKAAFKDMMESKVSLMVCMQGACGFTNAPCVEESECM
jgi:hypothetical protein